MATQTLTFMLTPRELDALKLVAQGLSNPDIAKRLAVSELTDTPGAWVMARPEQHLTGGKS